MAPFFVSWPRWAWAIFTFVSLLIGVVIGAVVKKLRERRRLLQYAAVAEQERQTGQQVDRPEDNEPFGIRALESGRQTQGTWISQHNTPEPAAASSQSHDLEHVTYHEDENSNLDQQEEGRRQGQRSNPFALRIAGNDAERGGVAAQQPSTSFNDGVSIAASAPLLPPNKPDEEGDYSAELSPTQGRQESGAASIASLALKRRNAVRVKSKGKQETSGSDKSSDAASDLSLTRSQSASHEEDGPNSRSTPEIVITPPEASNLPTFPRASDVTPFTQFRRLANFSIPSRGYRTLGSSESLPINQSAPQAGTGPTVPLRSALRPAYLERRPCTPSPPSPPPSQQTGPRIFRTRGTDFEMMQPRAPRMPSPVRLQDLTSRGRSRSAEE